MKRAAVRVKRAAPDDTEDHPLAKRTVLAGKKPRARVNYINKATAKSASSARSTNKHAVPPAPSRSASTLAQHAFQSVISLARSTLYPLSVESQTKNDAGAKNTKFPLKHQQTARQGRPPEPKARSPRASQITRDDSIREQQGSTMKLDKRVTNEIAHGDVLPTLTKSGWEFAGTNQTVTVAFAAGLALYHVVTNGVASRNVSFTGAQSATFLKAIMAAKGIGNAPPEHSGSWDGLAKVAGSGAAAYRLGPYWRPVLEAGLTGYEWYAGTG
ncbi:unnamed protein product [Diplocarpon coronariae]|uniref:Uncharacterized protein n=1 Tax=Diplocarpon coronariae TaxID=2795749 RepID=A0A218Z4L6_9HELO|nr:hypothetical protein B2J93_3667 [Marssonina coronariae]